MSTITNSTAADIPTIFSFYDMGVALQKAQSNRHWKTFERALIEKEIAEERQWKLLAGDKVAAVFLTAEKDQEIWGVKDRDDAIYLHRIVTHPDFRGQQLFAQIVNWAKQYAAAKGRQYLRMDTWGDNERLVNYYVLHGFTLLGVVTPTETGTLPAHYDCISLALLEMPL
jgi:GNAT superfamily N-acetyltransferase